MNDDIGFDFDAFAARYPSIRGSSEGQARLDAVMVLCDGYCGRRVNTQSVAKWHDRWWLCVQCKARSVTTGWLPDDRGESKCSVS